LGPSAKLERINVAGPAYRPKPENCSGWSESPLRLPRARATR
jgi:hypothetical protein